jgi:hypothetical protein
MRSKLSRPLDALVALTRRLIAAEHSLNSRDYVKQWLLRSDTQFYVALHKSLLVIMCIVEAAIYFLGREHARVPLLVANGIVIVLIFIAKVMLLKFNRSIAPLVGLMQIVAITGYGMALRNVAVANPTISGLTPMTILYPTVMAMALILSPFSTLLSSIIAAYMVAIPVVGLATAGITQGLDLIVNLMVIGGCAIFALVLNNIRMSRSRRQAQLELERRKLLAQNERLKCEAIEKEMALASKIQESLSSPRDFATDGGLTGSFYHRKVGILGGDWGAAKQHANGNTYIVVVDATGTGVAAALVVHAVQALWAAEISQPSFDPEQWIASVNRTLLALGRKAPQTLSMGLIAIGGGILRYYSAGHVPLYVIEDVAGESALRTLPSRGPMLGLSEPIQLVVGEIDIRKDGFRWILGGTDGIFTRETRFSRRRGLELIRKIETQGPEALLDTATDDDKILFVLKKPA